MLCVLLAGCATTQAPKPAADLAAVDTPPVRSSAEQRVLIQRVSLDRTGGFSGYKLHIDITPAGSYRSYTGSTAPGQSGLFGNEHAGELDDDTRKQLLLAFTEFDHYASVYKAPNGTADDYTYTVRYGDKTVVATDASPDVPASFIHLCKRLIEVTGQ